jgi:hypothetical protein
MKHLTLTACFFCDEGEAGISLLNGLTAKYMCDKILTCATAHQQ